MKKYMAIFGLFSAINSCNGQTGVTVTKTMLEEFNLKGKVKTVTYELEKENYKLYFDENGMLIKQENVFSREGIRGEVYDNYVYENGKLVSFEVFRIFAEIPTLFLEKTLFEYNSSGLLIHSDCLGRKEFYKYDEKGNRIERYGYVKTRQKFNAKGQVTEEWAFEDKETTIRKFHSTDGQGNPLPDVEFVREPYELPPNKYEHNKFGDVIQITYMYYSPLVTDSITYKYDDTGNWIERTANGSSASNFYHTAEQIYTGRFNYGQQYIRRTIEYYENVDIIGDWRIDAVLGEELASDYLRSQTDEYTLRALRADEDGRGRAGLGWRAEFKSDKTFTSGYNSNDGNDMAINVSGRYEYMDENHIKIHICSITIRGGEWHGRNSGKEEPDAEMGVFLIAPTENGFRLIRCADGVTDQQRLTYSDMVRALPKITTGSRDLKWVKLDPNHRDTDNLKILNKGLLADGRYLPDKAKLVFSRNISSGLDYLAAFVFHYEGKNIIALYSRGPEIFAIYDK